MAEVRGSPSLQKYIGLKDINLENPTDQVIDVYTYLIYCRNKWRDEPESITLNSMAHILCANYSPKLIKRMENNFQYGGVLVCEAVSEAAKSEGTLQGTSSSTWNRALYKFHQPHFALNIVGAGTTDQQYEVFDTYAVEALGRHTEFNGIIETLWEYIGKTAEYGEIDDIEDYVNNLKTNILDGVGYMLHIWDTSWDNAVDEDYAKEMLSFDVEKLLS